MSNKKLTLENYIFDLIAKREYDLVTLQKEREDYSNQAYWCLWNRYHGAIDDLYLSLAAHKNPLSQITDEEKGIIKKEKKKHESKSNKTN